MTRATGLIDKVSDRQGNLGEAFEIVRRCLKLLDEQVNTVTATTTVISAGHDLLSPTHTDAATQAVSRGSLVYGNSTPKWDELTVGASSTFLGADGTDVSWRLVIAGYPTFGIDLDGRTYSP